MPRSTPLVQLDERLWLLELFHGPTLAFKDLALQLVGLMFDAVLARRGEHVTIVGATSGDTGSAALEACRDRQAIDIFILYPQGRVSEVQRRQMTTVEVGERPCHRDRGHVRRLPGSRKALFADAAAAPRAQSLRGQLDQLGADRGADRLLLCRRSARSAPPARARLVQRADRQFRQCLCRTHRPRGSGCRSNDLVIGTNRNDILARYFATGRMALAAGRAEP